MPVLFREMKQNDVTEIIDVHRQSIYGLCKDCYSESQMAVWTSLFNHKIFNEGLKDSNNIGIVAVDNDKIIGYGFINLRDKEVKGMYLIPEFTKKGIGKFILSKLELIAREHGITELFLDSTLNAVNFYENCAYVKLRDEVFSLTPTCNLNCVHMSKTFK